MKPKIIIYGKGEAGRLAFEVLSKTHCVLAFCCSYTHGEERFMGKSVIRPADLSDYRFDHVVVASMHVKEITATLESFDVGRERIKVYESARIIIDHTLVKAKASFPVTAREVLSGTQDQIEAALSSELNGRHLAPEEHLLLADFFCANANFELYRAHRQQAIDQLLAASKPTRLTILALLDSGFIEQAVSLLSAPDHCLPPNEADVLLSLALLLMGDVNAAQAKARVLFTEQDRAFMADAENRRVALVGPAPKGFNPGAEPGRYDCLMTMGLPSEKPTTSASFQIRYVNAHALNYSGLDADSLRNTGSKYVFESGRHTAEQTLIKNREARAIPDPFNIKLFNGFPNFLQRVLIDFLLCVPVKELKLFNFDFYTSKNTYAQGYRDRQQDRYFIKPRNHLLQSQAVLHDFLTQIRFTRQLFKKGTIDVDEDLKDILNSDDDDYLKSLREKFSD